MPHRAPNPYHFSFEKFRCLLDKDPIIESKTHALSFVKFILSKTGDEKLETLCRLTSSEFGLQALQSAISFEMTVSFIREAVISLIQFVGKDERMTMGSARSTTVLKLLRTIFKTPQLFKKMVEFAVGTKQFDGEEALELGWFVLQILKAGDETSEKAKKSRHVEKLVHVLACSNYPGSKNVSQQISNFLGQVYEKVGDEVVQLEGIDSLRRNQPGWRHDNDKTDFRSIIAFPTAEELVCLEKTFLPKVAQIFEPPRGKSVSQYLDWAFRLLREDVVESIREEIGLLLRKEISNNFEKPSEKLIERLMNRTVKVVKFRSISCHHRFGIGFTMMFENLPEIQHTTAAEKRAYWQKRHSFLKEDSLLAFFRNETDLVYFGYVNVRDMAELTQENPPSIDVVIIGKEANRKIIEAELGVSQENLKAVQLSAPFFAYRPILERLKTLSTVPFQEEIAHLSNSTEPPSYCAGSKTTAPTLASTHPSFSFLKQAPVPNVGKVGNVVEKLEQLSPGADVGPVVGLKKTLILDQSQKDAVTLSLKRRIALIQGPPGTGKSFCGAVIAKIIHQFSEEKILCVCYTNHALDQFLEDLIDFGLPEDDIVRLGGSEKISQRISKLAIGTLLKDLNSPPEDSGDEIDSGGKRGGKSKLNQVIGSLHGKMNYVECVIEARMKQIHRLPKTKKMADFLSVMPANFVDAFKMPSEDDGSQIVGEDGAPLGPDYLWKQWLKGKDRGVIAELYPESNSDQAGSPWSLDDTDREKLVKEWREISIKNEIGEVERLIDLFNELKTELAEVYDVSRRTLLRSKRIIGCTSTGAAKYAKDLDSVSAGVVIIEEAGELLEPHVITSMASNCKHLIMIGDHKQLRPKLNVYQLTVESGSPYEFNRSLFERLVLNGFPHVTLELQHRMRPEFSHLIRELTYPNLKDAEKVKEYPNLLGTRSNLIFINHEYEEGESNGGTKQLALSAEDCMSKVNYHEVAMVTEIVQYLLKQGYRGEQIAVLTPYLGQLQALREAISDLNVKVDVSERDISDLNFYGFDDLSTFTPKVEQNCPLVRVATVDNYQGEESDIIIASLVRSNKEGIVGFVGEPERVNVLLSRARLGMILIGNMQTFENAKLAKGRQLWIKLLEMLKEKHAIFPGFPAFCSVHEQSFILREPVEFHKSASIFTSDVVGPPSYCPGRVCEFVRQLENEPSKADLAPPLRLSKNLVVDESQKKAVTLALRSKVSRIEGPPGTGKSLVAAVSAKSVHAFSQENVLLVSKSEEAVDEVFANFNQFEKDPGTIVARKAPFDSKRIVATSLTFARKFVSVLQAFDAGVLIVEDAYGIVDLLSLLKAISPNCQHLILLSSLKLNSVEHDPSNQSFFDHLALVPEADLHVQYRMRPDFSDFLRELFYPEIEDDESVKGLPNLLGTQSNLVFIDRNVGEYGSSLVSLVVEIVQYFLRQGYCEEQLLVLTPFCDQSEAFSGKLSKNQPIRVRGVGNSWQSEVGDIVVASLVGFVGETEKLELLISRARIGMVLMGNSATIEQAKSGDWRKFVEILKKKGAVYPGFPAVCSVHNHRSILATSNEFANFAPEGGCNSYCRKILSCGRHECQRKCHPEVSAKDHLCEAKIEAVCPNFGHPLTFPCSPMPITRALLEKACSVPVPVRCAEMRHEIVVPCCKSSELTQCSKCDLEGSKLKKKEVKKSVAVSKPVSPSQHSKKTRTKSSLK